MDQNKLEHIAQSLVQSGKGILAADESTASATKRLEAVKVASTPENRRRFRQILLTTPGLEKYLSGVILYDETFWQATDDKRLFREMLDEKDIAPGIKVDLGVIDLPGFPGEKVSRGLDTLPERIAEYAEYGAPFAKWRSVITIGDDIPTDECIGANTYVLARYARHCQDVGVVPIVEPEVLFDGTHTAERCEQVMAHTFDILFRTMRAFRVHLPGAVLKTSFVLPGKESDHEIDHGDVAERTSRVLHEHVPEELGGIVFLSGGQPPRDAFINLNRVIQKGPHPWGITFSYSRALQDPVLKAWASGEGDPSDIFIRQLEHAAAAQRGELVEADLDSENFVSHSQDL